MRANLQQGELKSSLEKLVVFEDDPTEVIVFRRAVQIKVRVKGIAKLARRYQDSKECSVADNMCARLIRSKYHKY